ncbi:hypothetical protein LEP1GSC036_4832 [Leptospira weilii str. 2006001853]|uniref:Leucine rich repeat protein n=6 Tax=Leptospira weilii TaxID=28184 RepID=A0A828Z3V5_9LEPT|nr:hypothetical protein LEP1GSC036_4832 [Leptospira weilii str. 2006001853]EMM74666.1 hypothetical protein LEP1GSC038_4398 [Leptospira weilii str. 2006001855]EMN45651.1 hypothetical protein LEP1GSC086_2496 [Leptospira weilii str. LNT 1234]
MEIGQLRNLQELDLSSNPIRSKEKENLRKALPKCDIRF